MPPDLAKLATPLSQDDLDQYNHRENIRIYGVPESSGKREDGEDILFQIAKELDIELDAWDIQRCHRWGRKPHRRANGKSNNGWAKPHDHSKVREL